MRILVVEDDIDIKEMISLFFKKEGALVTSVSSYNEAYDEICVYEYDCIIVDITLPDGNGLNLIKELKKKELMSCIIIISAKNSIEDKICGLEIGADDYLVKPFHMAELNARVKSVMRRRYFSGNKDIIFNELRIKPDARQVFVNDRELTLTPKEYELLTFFIMNKNRVLTKENIVEHLWGDSVEIYANSFDFIYTHIRNLRHKIMEAGGVDYIKSVYSIGYRFKDI